MFHRLLRCFYVYFRKLSVEKNNHCVIVLMENWRTNHQPLTSLQQQCLSLDVKSVIMDLEKGIDVNCYNPSTLSPIETAIRLLNVELTVLLMQHGATYRMSDVTLLLDDQAASYDQSKSTYRAISQKLNVELSPFSQLNVFSDLVSFTKRFLEFTEKVKESVSAYQSGHATSLCTHRCSNCSTVLIDIDTIVNCYIFHVMKIKRCDIIRLIFFKLDKQFTKQRINAFLQISVLYYRCASCFDILQTYKADIDVLRNQENIFFNFFAHLSGYQDEVDYYILHTLLDYNICVEGLCDISFHHMLHLPRGMSKTKHLLLKQTCWRSGHIGEEMMYFPKEKLFLILGQVKVYNSHDALFFSFCIDYEWKLFGQLFYAGYYPSLAEFLLVMFRTRTYITEFGLKIIIPFIQFTTGHVVEELSVKCCVEAMHRHPRKLQNICVITIRKAISYNVLYKCKFLPLPQQLKNMVTLDILL